MSDTAASFYITGGTLRQDAPSYVERQADKNLYEGLLQGEFCYVLTSRQMGKSSLMVHTAARLRDAGVAVVILDLTGVGQNLSVEQWYGGLLRRIGQQLDPDGDLEDELEAFWFAQEAHVGPLERWMTALRRVVLPAVGRRQTLDGSPAKSVGNDVVGETDTSVSRLPSPVSRLVIFVDEIDAIRSLAFSSDEFFAGIRECYNRRTQEPEFERLTFCLLGVASPSDLIQDTRTTPFNIGRRIELTDFTPAEAAPLAEGLVTGVEPLFARKHERAKARSDKESEQSLVDRSAPPDFHPIPSCFRSFMFSREKRELAQAEAHGPRAPSELLLRILYWTGGHPYLTQRLCQAVAQVPNPKSKIQNPKSAVDRLCEELFLSKAARAKDSNLLFVRERLLRSESDPSSLLDLYKKVRAGQRVAVEETNRLVDLLRLSGVARAQGGRLVVRNRIYERVFDRTWVVEHMPGAELRRQQAAYRRGLLRATGVAAGVLAVIATLSLVAVNQARRAQQRELSAQHNLYAADMNLAQQAWEAGNIARMRHLLEAHWPSAGQADLRGFEWRYLWRLCERGDALASLRGHTAGVGPVTFSPDGKLLASGSDDKTIRLWDVATRRQVAILEGHRGGILSLAFSRDGKRLMTGSDDNTVRLWEQERSDARGSRRVVSMLKGRQSWDHVVFSPDGKTMATINWGPDVELWDLITHRQLPSLRGHTGHLQALAFSPDGKLLATGNFDTTVKLWDIASRRELPCHLRHKTALMSLAFSPTGRILASGSWGGTMKLWDIPTQKELAALPAHKGEVSFLAFSPEGRLLVSGGADTTLKVYNEVYNVAARQKIATLKGHAGGVQGMAFSPDGQTLATGSADKTVKLWSLAPGRVPGVLQGRTGWAFSPLAFSPDSRILAVGGHDGKIRLWDPVTERKVATLPGHRRPVSCVAFSPDGKILATGSGVWNKAEAPGELKLWEVTTRREIAVLKQEHALFSVAFSPDGQTLASASGDGSVTVRDRDSLRVIADLPSRGWGWNSAVAFSPGGQILASSATAADTVQLWDVSSLRQASGTPRSEGEAPRRPFGTLGGEGEDRAAALDLDRVTALAFSPDGRTLATGGGDRRAKLWDMATRRRNASLEGIEGQILSVAFSPDGRTLALAHQDGAVKLWDVATRREVLTLRGHTDVVDAVAFAPDGNTLASLSDDGTVRLWRAAPAAEVEPVAASPRP